MYWPGCQDGGLRQKEYQSWVADLALFQVISLLQECWFWWDCCQSRHHHVSCGQKREVSVPTSHTWPPTSWSGRCSCPVIWDVVCPGIAIQAVCPNSRPLPLQEHIVFVSHNPFSPSIQSRQWGYIFTNFACAITSPTCTGELGVPDTIGNSGIMAFCNPFLLTHGVPEELSTLGSKAHYWWVDHKPSLGRTLPNEKWKRVFGCTELGFLRHSLIKQLLGPPPHSSSLFPNTCCSAMCPFLWSVCVALTSLFVPVSVLTALVRQGYCPTNNHFLCSFSCSSLPFHHSVAFLTCGWYGAWKVQHVS